MTWRCTHDLSRPSRRSEAALEAKLEGLPRDDIAARAALISKTYRDGGNSRAITSDTDALAYALVRMPATYAAVDRQPERACRDQDRTSRRKACSMSARARAQRAGRRPRRSPRSRDSCCSISTPPCRRWRWSSARDSARLAAMACRRDAQALEEAEPADLVIASYLIGEVGEAERRTLVERLWAKTRDTLLVVEPGTPAGYKADHRLRAQLVASGAHVAAPCPHERECPLSNPDWCHFAQRLPRLRAHIQIKGAELPFEDEKFSYVVLTRQPETPAAFPRAGAAGGRQGRGSGQALHRRRCRDRESPAARQDRLCDSPPLALGRCGT